MSLGLGAIVMVIKPVGQFMSEPCNYEIHLFREIDTIQFVFVFIMIKYVLV